MQRNSLRSSRTSQRLAGCIIHVLALGASFAGCGPIDDESEASAAAIEELIDPSPAAEVGRTAGALEVSDDGVATYTIPIIAPPGRNGMAPALSVGYASGQSDGPLGAGWSLTGLSSIARCPPTDAIDGERAAVQFDDTDPLCLDGRRLILVEGDHAGVGAVYRPEFGVERVVLTIAPLSSPDARFEVWSADGSRAYYGGSPDTEVRGPRYVNEDGQLRIKPGEERTLSWLIRRVRDTSGNTIEITYTRFRAADGIDVDDQNAFEMLPSQIAYTGDQPSVGNFEDHSAGLRRVDFLWAKRENPTVAYVSGMPLLTSQTLRRITTSAPFRGGRWTLREYRLEYATGPTSGRPRLYNVRECEGNGRCLPPTYFGYSDTGLPTPVFAPAQDSMPVPEGWQDARQPLTTTWSYFAQTHVVAADPRGDGHPGLLYWERGAIEDGSGDWYFRRGRADGTFESPTLAGLAPITPAGVAYFTPVVADLDHDGRDDVIMRTDADTSSVPHSLAAMTSVRFTGTGSGTTPFGGSVFDALVPCTTASHWYAFPAAFPTDLDGDGFVEPVFGCIPAEVVGAPAQEWSWFTREIDPSGWRPPLAAAADYFPRLSADPFPMPPQPARHHIYPIDIEGDGRTEILLSTFGSSAFSIARDGSPPGAVADSLLPFPPASAPGYTERTSGYVFPDVNADGLRDAVLIQPARAPQLFLSTGRGFLPSVGALASGALPTDVGIMDVRMADVNADRRDDLIVLVPTAGSINGTVMILLSNGRRFVNAGTNPSLDAGTRAAVSPFTAENRVWPVQQFADFNADGRVDWLSMHLDGTPALYTQRNLMPFPDLLVRVEQEHEFTAVTYTTAGDRTVYQPEADDGECSLPDATECLRSGRLLVSRVDVPDGLGSHRTLTYRYFNGRTDIRGRGWLGFARTEVEEDRRGMRTRWFDNSSSTVLDGRLTYPFAGMVLNELYQQRIDVTVHQRIAYTSRKEHLFHRSEAGHFFAVPMIAEESLQLHDFLGDFTDVSQLASADHLPFYSRTTTIETVDDYGEPMKSRTRVAGGDETTTSWSRSTTDLPYDGHSPWRIGLVTGTEETSTPHFETPTESQTRTVRYGYDALSRLETVTRVAAGVSHAGPTRDSVLRFTREPGQHGNVTRIDEEGFVPEDLAGVAWSPVTRTLELKYEPEGVFLSTVTNSLGHVERITYNPVLGLPVEQRDAMGLLTTIDYDGFGRPVQTVAPSGARYDVVYGASEFGWLGITVTGNDGSVVSTALDTLGRPVHTRTAIALPGSIYTHFSHETLEYDHYGRPVSASLPYFDGEPVRRDVTVYDGLDRPIVHIRQDHHYRAWDYDGRTTTTSDYNGNKEVDVLDANLRLASHDEGEGGAVVNHEYGFFGHPTRTRLTGPHVEVVSRFVHGAWGAPLELIDPDAGTRRRAFSTFGEIRAERDSLGQVAMVTRDILGRPTDRTHPEDGQTTWLWDGADDGPGRLSAGCTNADAPSERVCLEYEYSANGQIRQERWQHPTGSAYQVDRVFDGLGRIREVRYPERSGVARFSARYVYDQAGMLAAVEDGASSTATPERLFTVQERDAFGRVTREHVGPTSLGVDTQRGFDPLSTRLDTQISTAGSTVLDALAYDYDGNGNVLSRFEESDAPVTETMTYDGLDRMATYSRSGSAMEVYEYDALGNPTLMAGVPQTFGTTPGDLAVRGPHALRSGRGTDSNYRYDGNGRLIHGDRSLRNGDTRTYSWRSSGLPRTVQVGASVTRYRYDSNERRVSSEAGTARTVYVGEFAEIRQNGADPGTHVYHVFAEGREVVQVERGPGAGAALDLRLVLSDGLGNVTTVASAAGVATERFALDPWGNSVRETASSVQDRFNGHELERDLGTIDMHGRIYEPETGRFLTPDPIVQAPSHGQSYNRYSYVFNNPATNVDPTGFQCSGVCDGPPSGGGTSGVPDSGPSTGPGDVFTSAGTGHATGSGGGTTGPTGIGALDRMITYLQATIDYDAEVGAGIMEGVGVTASELALGTALLTTAVDMAPVAAGLAACVASGVCLAVVVALAVGGVAAGYAHGEFAARRLLNGSSTDPRGDARQVTEGLGMALVSLATLASAINVGRFAAAPPGVTSGGRLGGRLGGRDVRPARVVRVISHGEAWADLVNEALLGTESGPEHTIVSLETGERLILSGGRDGISGLVEMRVYQVLLHTHGYRRGIQPGYSAPDVMYMGGDLRQRSSYLFEQDETGAWFGGRMRLRWPGSE